MNRCPKERCIVCFEFLHLFLVTLLPYRQIRWPHLSLASGSGLLSGRIQVSRHGSSASTSCCVLLFNKRLVWWIIAVICHMTILTTAVTEDARFDFCLQILYLLCKEVNFSIACFKHGNSLSELSNLIIVIVRGRCDSWGSNRGRLGGRM